MTYFHEQASCDLFASDGWFAYYASFDCFEAKLDTGLLCISFQVLCGSFCKQLWGHPNSPTADPSTILFPVIITAVAEILHHALEDCGAFAHEPGITYSTWKLSKPQSLVFERFLLSLYLSLSLSLCRHFAEADLVKVLPEDPPTRLRKHGFGSV